MPKITADPTIQTVITTFEVTPGTCDDLLEELRLACNEFVSKQPGFIGAAMHVNDARTRVANYTQWESREDFQTMLRSKAMRQYHMKFNDLAKSFEPVLYEVVTATD
ncbi:antibiotic biosynthesis monooxygenase [Maritimibacter sp. HL-12]|jgi:heme-degrading monooxygenase HmoA|uniref:antibiotic biosynthesis monooxygenase family protein n=1 Tax=Maritimibacter sp. HL-12 TaxID=1162418 RepID=UPI000A0F0229|nr:antibiotic biosynthesis monooxygenase family protein [Maritimibacter sp. HL-12]SMH32772.1 Heme-degrading monooxygenase HmoA [Maritimibacter sp. HL-12]